MAYLYQYMMKLIGIDVIHFTWCLLRPKIFKPKFNSLIAGLFVFSFELKLILSSCCSCCSFHEVCSYLLFSVRTKYFGWFSKKSISYRGLYGPWLGASPCPFLPKDTWYLGRRKLGSSNIYLVNLGHWIKSKVLFFTF